MSIHKEQSIMESPTSDFVDSHEDVENESNDPVIQERNEERQLQQTQHTQQQQSQRTQQQRTTRQRTIMVPVDPRHENMRLFSGRMKEVHIDDLTDEEKTSKMNMNRNYLDVQLIRLIMPSQRDQKVTVYTTVYRNGKKSTSQQGVPFRRIFLCRINPEKYKTESDNGRLLYLMIGSDSNNVMFEDNMEHCDDGTVSVGNFFRILQPLPIENSMKGDIPLVRTQLPIISLKTPSYINTTSINKLIQEGNTNCFVLNRQYLILNQTAAIQTTCSGLLCDRQRVNDWNGKSKCGCYSMFQYRSNLSLQHSIRIDTQQVKLIQNDFSSLKFSHLYLSNDIPSNVKVSSLRVSEEFWELEDCIESVVDFINENGGWTVVGWYKRGEVKDQSLNESTGNNNSDDNTIGAGTVKYHVVQLCPTNRDILDKRHLLGQQLEAKKYDVSKFQRV